MVQQVCVLVASFSISSGLQAQPIQFPGSPAPVLLTTFQEALWDDLWSDTFIDGSDILISTDPLLLPSQDIHRLEWDSTNNQLDGFENEGTITDVDTWEMNWLGYESESFSIDETIDGEDVFWEPTVTIETSSFSATITSDGSYSPYIYGIMRSVEIVESALSGGNTYTYHVWMPLGRGKSLADASLAAEGLANTIYTPQFLIEETDPCDFLWGNRANQAHLSYLSDLDGCGDFGNVAEGIIDGMLVGGGTGTVIGGGVGFFFGGIGAGPGAVGGAIIFGIIGGITGPFVAVANCNSDAYDDYRNRMDRWNDCLNECLQTGTWFCN